MQTSYKKLWKILIDRDLKKKDLMELAGVSTYTINKLSHGENVTMDILTKICSALKVDICDIVSLEENPVKNNY